MQYLDDIIHDFEKIILEKGRHTYVHEHFETIFSDKSRQIWTFLGTEWTIALLKIKNIRLISSLKIALRIENQQYRA